MPAQPGEVPGVPASIRDASEPASGAPPSVGLPPLPPVLPPVPLPDVLVPLVEVPPAPTNAPPAPDVLALVTLPEVLVPLPVPVVVLDGPWPPESATPAQPRARTESSVAEGRRP